jgi:hypothetical protein
LFIYLFIFLLLGEENLQNFDLKKNDFNIYKGFFHMKKKDPNLPDFEELFFLQDFYYKFE